MQQDQMLNSDLFEVFKEMVRLCQKIDTLITEHSSADSSDEDFFVYHFFHRSLVFGNSIVLLVDNHFFHEATLVARNVLEGLFYFQAHRFQIISGLPKKWRLYALYEDYRMTKEEDRQGLLNDIKKRSGNKIVREAQNEYDFQRRRQNWFSLGTRRELAEQIDKKLAQRVGYEIGMASLYDTLYNDFSQITHWTPRGVIIGDRNINAAIAVCIQSLHTISEYVNNRYQLSFDEDLRRILGKHFSIAHVELKKKISAQGIGASPGQAQ